MDQVMLEVDLHLVNNIRVIYYLVSNSVEKRVLINKIILVMEKIAIIVFQLRKYFTQR